MPTFLRNFARLAKESRTSRAKKKMDHRRENRALKVFFHLRAMKSRTSLARALPFGREKNKKIKQTWGAQPSANATPETPTVIFASSFIWEYKVAPETNCIKAINAKKAVNNFVVNCIVICALLL